MFFDIKQRRKELGLTLEEVGKLVGVSKSTVKKWESGYIKNMRSDKIKLLAHALRVSPLDIIDLYDSSPTFRFKTAETPITPEYTDFINSFFKCGITENLIICHGKTHAICHELPKDLYKKILELLSYEKK